PLDQLDPDALGDAVDLEAGVGEQRLARRFAVEAEHERLGFFDALRAVTGQRRFDRRPAGRELEARRAADGFAAQAAQIAAQREAAAHAGGKILVEVVDPGAAIDPARGAGLRAIDG